MNKGTLYLCATPIGNLEDMTFRAVRILQEVAVIAAEDTRHTRKLLSHYNIHTPLISYHEHNKAVRGEELIARLEAGQDVAVVSDAGLPGISDPGADLVKLAVNAGIIVSPVPGPSAGLSALVCSGLDSERFLFVGFLPKTAKKRRELLAALVSVPYTLIFYESPHRIMSILKEMMLVFGGERRAVAGRELTKKFEEFIRGTIETLSSHFAQDTPRGEFVLLVEAATIHVIEPEPVATDDLAEAVRAMVEQGVMKKDAIRLVALERGVPKREVYQAVLQET
ncbi:MAG: rsmI [Firmicutes bacterium]|nr:rsmI [Bacillota bacterium]